MEQKISFVVTVGSAGPASANLLACRILWVCKEGRSREAIRDKKRDRGGKLFIILLRTLKSGPMFTR